MGPRLDYGKLIKGWMQYYSLPEDAAEKMFGSIWSHLQESKKLKPDEKAALRPLYRESYNDVYRMVKSMIREEETVRDIVQKAYIKGFDGLSAQEDPAEFLPQMKIIARNMAVDWFKGTQAFSSLKAKEAQTVKKTKGTETDE